MKPSFETNVPGIFIAGELGGMGLVRKAAQQGRQAMEHIAKDYRGSGDQLDVVIVCAGGILPMPMLKEIGIRVETKYGTE